MPNEPKSKKEQTAGSVQEKTSVQVKKFDPEHADQIRKDRPRNNFGDLKRVCWKGGETALSTRSWCDESLPGFRQASHEVVV